MSLTDAESVIETQDHDLIYVDDMDKVWFQ